jgi:hypothetical protein
MSRLQIVSMLLIARLTCLQAYAGTAPDARPEPPVKIEAKDVASVVNDLILGPRGVVTGQVVERSGKARAKVRVVLLRDQREIAATYTDADGHFEFAGVSPGTVQIVSGRGTGIFRVWTAVQAPPSALPRALIVDGGLVVRGQGCKSYRWIECHPYLFYAGVATAITVPLVLLGSSDDPASP